MKPTKEIIAIPLSKKVSKDELNRLLTQSILLDACVGTDGYIGDSTKNVIVSVVNVTKNKWNNLGFLDDLEMDGQKTVYIQINS